MEMQKTVINLSTAFYGTLRLKSSVSQPEKLRLAALRLLVLHFVVVSARINPGMSQFRHK
jgi:hypothetical protein